MKPPPRPFIVEFKRRGRKLAAAAKASIWPDLSVFREIGGELNPAMATANTASPEPEIKAGPVPGPDVVADGATGHALGSVIESAGTRHEMAKPASTRATKTRKLPKPADAQSKVADAAAAALNVDHGRGDEPVRFQRGGRKARRWLRKDKPTFPIGQRWKRRLPKVLW